MISQWCQDYLIQALNHEFLLRMKLEEAGHEGLAAASIRSRRCETKLEKCCAILIYCFFFKLLSLEVLLSSKMTYKPETTTRAHFQGHQNNLKINHLGCFNKN